MTKNIIPFFATEKDLSRVLEAAVAKRPLQFVVAGMFDSPDIQIQPSLSRLDPIANYLVAERETAVEVRSVPQKSGGQKYAVDQLANPKTIVIRPGGLIDEHCLVSGQIGTVGEDQVALSLFKLIATEMRKQFSKVKAYYVGEQASELLDSGVRLTTNPKSEAIYDLAR